MIQIETDELAQVPREAIQGCVRFDHLSRRLYSTNVNCYQMFPIGVVLPCTVEDVTEVLEIAAQLNVSVLPRGGRTSLFGQSVGEGTIPDTSRYPEIKRTH
jgi:FAD/FMN-containing dehydrogenase